MSTRADIRPGPGNKISSSFSAPCGCIVGATLRVFAEAIARLLGNGRDDHVRSGKATECPDTSQIRACGHEFSSNWFDVVATPRLSAGLEAAFSSIRFCG